ncbi:STAS domain-containing protein [Amycolatopsis sp. cmx-11-51]|uniref:STAS domain-containing protein n=1 Tax=unclassified Amycolatopsis TaxID=2618356 RepID=UPI0039E7217F
MENAAVSGGQDHDQRDDDLGLRISDLPGASGIQVSGAIDVTTRATWGKSLGVLVTTGGTTVDLSGLTYTDVHGVSALVEAARQARAIKIRHPPENVQKVLRLFWPEESEQLLSDDGRPR